MTPRIFLNTVGDKINDDLFLRMYNPTNPITKDLISYLRQDASEHEERYMVVCRKLRRLITQNLLKF